jgi:ribosomal protein S18 acetylase RimI-like enzyme
LPQASGPLIYVCERRGDLWLSVHRRRERTVGFHRSFAADEPSVRATAQRIRSSEACLESTVTLRLARPSDAGTIAATLRAAFAGFEGQYTAPAFAATTPTREQVTDRFPEGPIWLAERDGQVLGTVSVVSGPGELYIRSMAVHPAARGQGIGARLLRAVEEFAAPRGHRRLVLTTTSFLRPAIRLYEQAGFRFTGEQADLFGTGLLWMAKDLSREGLRRAAP